MTNDQRAIIEALPGWMGAKKGQFFECWVDEHDVRKIVEIGVYGGRSLMTLAVAILNDPPVKKGPMRVIGIDPWSVADCLEGMKEKANIEWWSKNADLDRALGCCVKASHVLGVNDIVEIVVATSQSDKARRRVTDDYAPIDILHIDGCHSLGPAMRDAKLYVPLVGSGGLVCFDDEAWHEGGEPTVAKAIEWANTEGGCEYICSVDGAAMLRKK